MQVLVAPGRFKQHKRPLGKPKHLHHEKDHLVLADKHALRMHQLDCRLVILTKLGPRHAISHEHATTQHRSTFHRAHLAPLFKQLKHVLLDRIDLQHRHSTSRNERLGPAHRAGLDKVHDVA